MKKYAILTTVFIFCFNFLFAQFPYHNEDHILKYKEKPEFLGYLSVYPLQYKKDRDFIKSMKSDISNYDYLTDNGVIDKIIKHKFSLRADTTIDFTNVIKYNQFKKPVSDERWKDEKMEYRKEFFYNDENEVSEIKIHLANQSKLTFKYLYDSLDRVVQEKIIKEYKINGKNFLVEAEKHEIEYEGENIILRYFELGKLQKLFKYVYEEGSLSEKLYFFGRKKKLMYHVKFNKKGQRIFLISENANYYQRKYDEKGHEVSLKMKEKYSDDWKVVHLNPNKYRYDEFDNLTYSEVWQSGRYASIDSFLYKYDAIGNIIEATRYEIGENSSMKEIWHYKNFYNDNGLKIKAEKYDDKKRLQDSTLFKYSEQNRLILSEYYPAVLYGKLRSSTEITYFENGEIQSRSWYDGNKNLESKEGFVIDSLGRKVERYFIPFYHNDDGQYEYNYKREYDSFGRLSKQIHFLLHSKKPNQQKIVEWEVYYK